MMHRFLKTAVGAALVLLLFAALFCGTVSAIDITSNAWNDLDLTTATDTEYHFINGGTEPIEPKFCGAKDQALTLSSNLKLDFTGFNGDFAGYSGSDKYAGALFGYVAIGEHTLEIIGLNMTTVSVTSTGSDSFVGGIIGCCDGKLDISFDPSFNIIFIYYGNLTLTNCHLQNCSIKGDYVAGLVCSASTCEDVSVSDCSLQYCDVISMSNSIKDGIGGLVGSSGDRASFDKCIVEMSTISCLSPNGRVGGLVGFTDGGVVSITECCVKDTSIYSGHCVGGLIGDANKIIIADSEVMNCVITIYSKGTSGGNEQAGGLSGWVKSGVNINDCTVTNCTISNFGNGNELTGGLFGQVQKSFEFSSVNCVVENCAVRGEGVLPYSPFTEYTNLTCGGVAGREIPCTTDNGNFIKSNTTYTDTIVLKNADDEEITAPYTDFWKVISYTTAKHANEDDDAAVTVTNIGKYGVPGGYGAGSIPPVPYTVTRNPDTGGTVTPSESGTAQPGKTVTITATPKSGYGFVSWTSSPKVTFAEPTSERTTFTMPAQDVTITANFNITAAASVKGYVYNSSSELPKPTLPEITADTFYYSDSAAAHDDSKTWASLKPTTLNAGTYYVYAKVGELESKRGTFKVIPADQPKPGFIGTPEATDGYIKVTIGDGSIVKSYEYQYVKASTITPTEEKWIPASGNEVKITGLEASQNYSIAVRAKANTNYNASPESKVEDVQAPAVFSVTYNANGGTGGTTQLSKDGKVTLKPTSIVKREGYTVEANWYEKSDGTGTSYSADQIVSTGMTLYANWTANTYNVTFNGNGATSVAMEEQQFTYNETPKELTANAFQKDGNTFAGWATSANGPVVYADKQKVQNLASSGTVTLYAVWTTNPIIVTGSISGAEGDVTIKLMRGTAEIQSKGFGNKPTNYNMDSVPAGTYNLVATDERTGKTVTVTYIASGSSGTQTVDISFPPSSVSSVLEVSDKQNTPAVVVGGLDQEAVSKAETGKDITVTMKVEAKVEAELPADAPKEEKEVQAGISAIKVEAAGKTLQFLDVEVTKTVKEGGVESDPEVLHETSTIIEILIPFDTTDKENIVVYRYHDNEAKPLEKLTVKPETSFVDGTFWIDNSAKIIYVYSKKFSQYAVGYTAAGSSPDPQPQTHSSSSRNDGYSVWLQETPAPTQTPGDVSGTNATQIQPSASPVQPQQQTSTPAPFIGLLAGLGAAAVFFGLRRR